jgi:uncharacterized glyoxalase superfamily protein PhnB
MPGQDVHLYFESEDLDGEYRRLMERGVEFTRPPQLMGWGWQHAFFKDPDGRVLSIYDALGKRFQASPES